MKKTLIIITTALAVFLVLTFFNHISTESYNVASSSSNNCDPVDPGNPVNAE